MLAVPIILPGEVIGGHYQQYELGYS